MTDPAIPPPDDRDWTFVITDGCPECGFRPQPPETTGDRIRAAVPRWRAALERPDAVARPQAEVWSTLEYACHVRDACRIFRGRLALMLAEHDPVFANWDQDETAIEEQYFRQSPAVVADELAAEATAIAEVFDSVQTDQWRHPGRRSNGSVFTVATFSVYFLHDIEHHLYDVSA